MLSLTPLTPPSTPYRGNTPLKTRTLGAVLFQGTQQMGPSQNKPSLPPIHLLQGSIRDADSPLRVVNLFTGFTRPSANSGTGALNEELSGEINRLIDQGDVSGQAGRVSLILNGRHNIMVIGLGRQENWRADAVSETAKIMVMAAAEKKYTQLATILHGAGTGGMAPLSSFHYLKQGVNEANQLLIEQGKTPVEVTIVTNNPEVFSLLLKAQQHDSALQSGLPTLA